MSDELKPQSVEKDSAFQCLLWHYLNARVKLSAGRIEEDEAAIAFRALIAHIDAWRVPPGYKLGPIGSTAEMDLAGRNALRACGNEQATTRDAELCWSAMIDAAPDKGDEK